MRSDEILNLRWGDVVLRRVELIVPKSKTDAGKGRLIPLNANLLAVLNAYAAFYLSRFGELRGEWYLFPFSSRQKPVDPNRPTTTLKSAGTAVRAAAGVECRFHDLRHTGITRMAEAVIPEQTIKSIAGHVSQEDAGTLRAPASRSQAASGGSPGVADFHAEFYRGPHKIPHSLRFGQALDH
jgi:integrase